MSNKKNLAAFLFVSLLCCVEHFTLQIHFAFQHNFYASHVPVVLCMVLLLKAGASLHIPHVYACLPACLQQGQCANPCKSQNAERNKNTNGGRYTGI